jgi:hypothetical protein
MVDRDNNPQFPGETVSTPTPEEIQELEGLAVELLANAPLVVVKEFQYNLPDDTDGSLISFKSVTTRGGRPPMTLDAYVDIIQPRVGVLASFAFHPTNDFSKRDTYINQQYTDVVQEILESSLGDSSHSPDAVVVLKLLEADVAEKCFGGLEREFSASSVSNVATADGRLRNVGRVIDELVECSDDNPTRSSYSIRENFGHFPLIYKFLMVREFNYNQEPDAPREEFGALPRLDIIYFDYFRKVGYKYSSRVDGAQDNAFLTPNLEVLETLSREQPIDGITNVTDHNFLNILKATSFPIDRRYTQLVTGVLKHALMQER